MKRRYSIRFLHRVSARSAVRLSALDLEYTLPDVSQSVIITRMAGRTPVPDKGKYRIFRCTSGNDGRFPDHSHAG